MLQADRPSAACALLEAAGDARLDLLVTDVMLPEESGASLADALVARVRELLDAPVG